MKKNTFDIILATLWAINTIIALVSIFSGVEVNAWCAFCPSLLCLNHYIGHIRGDK